MIEINMGREDDGAMTRFTKVIKALEFITLGQSATVTDGNLFISRFSLVKASKFICKGCSI